MSNVPTINVDEIAEFGQRPPVGKYIATLSSVEGKESKAKKPMFVATFVVSEGEHEGKELTVFHSLVTSKSKDGRTIAGGIADAKRTFAAIGNPLPAGFAFPLSPDHAATLYGKRLKGHRVEIVVFTEPARSGELGEDGKPKVYTRTKVVGAVKAPAAVAAQAVDDFDFGD
jgi:hypothetical protein